MNINVFSYFFPYFIDRMMVRSKCLMKNYTFNEYFQESAVYFSSEANLLLRDCKKKINQKGTRYNNDIR